MTGERVDEAHRGRLGGEDVDPQAVVCVHPGWPMLRGRDHVLRSWSAVMAGTLRENEQTIVEELLAVQGKPADIGGYFRPDPEKAAAVMRPSTTFNEALATIA